MGHKILPRLGFGAALMTLCAGVLAQNAMTTTSADLYAGPDDSYPMVAQVDSNTPVQVYGCLDDWSWCDVGFQDARGWLYSPDITYMYQGGYVPLYSYAPSLGIAVEPFSVDVYWGHYYQGRPWFAKREDWAHRTVNHRRPSGPPPSANRPPRPEPGGPRVAARPDDHDHPIHLGSTTHPEHGNPQVAPRPEQHTPSPPVPQHDEHANNGPGRAAPPAHEEHAKPMEHSKAPEEHGKAPEEHGKAPQPPKDEDHPH
jgi:uncharacterized protein YraI